MEDRGGGQQRKRRPDMTAAFTISTTIDWCSLRSTRSVAEEPVTLIGLWRLPPKPRLLIAPDAVFKVGPCRSDMTEAAND